MKKVDLFVSIVFGLAGVVACIDIILAEFFDRGTPPDLSFMIVLLFWVVFPHGFSKNKFVQIPLALSIILYVLSYCNLI
mgnify:FL=1